MNPTTIEILGTVMFAVAIVHTFLVQKILNLSHHFPKNSIMHGFLHLMSEIEIVFGFWAAIFLSIMVALSGAKATVEYQESLNFTEPLFVFCIMVMAATRPVLGVARDGIQFVSALLRKVFRTPEKMTDIFVVLTLGPLSGSFITEPAAMTVTALLLVSMFHSPPARLAYFLMGVLFVNVSVGGALTPYAAPPILMVAGKWGWDFAFVFQHFGLKSIATVVINALILVLYFRKDIQQYCYSLYEADKKQDQKGPAIPFGVTVLHLLFLVMLVVTAHYMSVFMGVFLFFLGLTTVTRQYQDHLRLRESLLVAFFLGGIIVFGAYQKWWLEPLLSSMSDALLFKGATALTAITDNAALTYLGAQVPTLSVESRYALVAGAIAGGGLTVIANAPNPAGFSILNPRFPGGNVNPIKLFVAALVPTAVAVVCLWYLPH
ncbi:putative Na+/H+ antiporter [Bdellovibrio sp. HCB337]|uniref:putative Na+/H+ antiporter n=1 Tax=Bdellovibrio sp. HCB337 TaxID=3394358 RepID=UPI0039A41108